MLLTRDLASKLGRDLPDIDDDEESEDEDDRRSSGGIASGSAWLIAESSLERLHSNASRETMKRHSDSDESDSSDQALDLAALKRSRLQHPGTISLFESANEHQDEGFVEKVRDMFDLPASEKFITGCDPSGWLT
jgi:hypothetical protein